MAPSFAIEVPGETNPLTENLLVHTLRAASSSDPHQIQTGTKQLQQWEKSRHYYSHLQSAFLDRRLPLEVRYLAIIQLKNGIEKYWRRTALNAVSKEDKDVIRGRLVEGAVSEPDDRLALQSSLVFAKIARFEYPDQWPTAISDVLTILRRSPDSRTIARCLLLLLHVTKELSTGRLQRTKQTLQAATPEIIYVTAEYYATKIRGIIDSLGVDASRDLSSELRSALLSIKLVRRLLVFGYEHPNREQDVAKFWSMSIQCLGELITLAKSDLPPKTSILVEKHMLQLSKLHHEMAKDHPGAFVLLPNSLDLVLSYWSIIKEVGKSWGSASAVLSELQSAKIGTDGDQDGRTNSEKFALRGMLVIRACVRMVHDRMHMFKYRKPEDKEEQKQAAALVQSKILTQDFVREVMETVVTKFFVFRASDLQQWEEEPEEWEKREDTEGDDWEFSIRPCAEKLFLDLAINYKDIIVEPLLGVLAGVATPNNEDILLKDSIYTAVGLAASVLETHLDVDALIRDTLTIEVQKTAPGFNILHRRIAILLGQWAPVKLSQDIKPTVYKIFQHLLSVEDQVVKVTAGRQLKNVVDEWNFEPATFIPYAEPIMTSLMRLIGEVELIETKLALLNTISIIVDHLEHHISPFAERIIALLPPLWEQSGEEHLMKQSILAVLTRLVNSMKADSLPFHAMVIPIIRGAIVPDSDSQVYLLEDALELWQAILTQTPDECASDDVLALASHLTSIFELGSESLRVALEITTSYILLAPAHMLSDNVRRPILACLAGLIGTLRAEATGTVFVVLEAMIRAAERLGGESAINVLLADLTGVFSKLVDGLRGSWQAHCTTGPHAKTPPVDGGVETDYFVVLARLLLTSPANTCQAIASVRREPVDVTMKWLLEEWFSHFENIGDPSRRKLMCLALTKLLDAQQPWILLNLQSLMNMWTDVVREVYEEGQDISGADSLVKAETALEGPESPEDGRRRVMMLSDPVHTISVVDWIKHHLQAVASLPNFQDEWVANVDREVLNSFTALQIM